MREEVEELLEKLQTLTSVGGQGDADVARDVIVDISEVFGKDLSPVTYGKLLACMITCVCHFSVTDSDIRKSRRYYFNNVYSWLM